MGVYVFTDGKFSITVGSSSAVSLSSYVKAVTISVSKEAKEKTAMGESTKTRIAGVGDWNMKVDFNQDFAAGMVDATLWAALNATALTVAARAVNTSISATNPEWTGSALLFAYDPIGGNHGDLAVTSVVFEANGVLTRDITP